MQPTEILANEHRIIEQVLTCLEKIADQACSTKTLDVTSAEQALDFFRNFADRCHHAKEEDLLFPLLEAKGIPRNGGPTGVMLYEHDEGRKHIRAMANALLLVENGEDEGLDRFVHHARLYILLLREHIQKEDHCLFPMADCALSKEEQEGLSHSFAHVEQEDMGEGTHEKYIDIAEQLSIRLGVPGVYSGEGNRNLCKACGH